MAENPQDRLKEYFKKNIRKGYTTESLKWALVRQGYSRTAVDRAIEHAHRELAEKAPVLKEKPRIKYQILDADNKPIEIKQSWWRRIFG